MTPRVEKATAHFVMGCSQNTGALKIHKAIFMPWEMQADLVFELDPILKVLWNTLKSEKEKIKNIPGLKQFCLFNL